jgi:hypothetical protein
MMSRPTEFLGNIMLLIVGGNDTTRNSISGGLLALNQYPDEYRKLHDNPALIPNMVSEMIRWQTPVIHMRRTAVTDTELGMALAMSREQRERKAAGLKTWGDAFKNPLAPVTDKIKAMNPLKPAADATRGVLNDMKKALEIKIPQAPGTAVASTAGKQQRLNADAFLRSQTQVPALPPPPASSGSGTTQQLARTALGVRDGGGGYDSVARYSTTNVPLPPEKPRR